ncbi:glycosyltransferase [Ectobacillus antri]|jgi:GT2 family glycosyltransferase|uniref:Glycosyltransferase n=1 Tax=Ectobacillus antri TaxID=2486280 RepID=A0ABT6H465_9BACI|nr:glycosyltransferase [Ectobacillus antri]MDG4656623.1 glycosyltransferase [Ectobacillus antri]MDG5754014.1 glycosyltransferase [Ectobacillus antri]
MTIAVSVIMNSHNKYPQNLLSLYALEHQNFDLSKLEVILIDDASTDETPLLNCYTPPYTFRYIRCEENVGRSKAKNMGIYASQGDVLIILDAEMLVGPEFVQQHYQYHQTDDHLIVTGCTNHYGVYTVVDYGMDKKDFAKFSALAKRKLSRLPRNTREIVKKSILKQTGAEQVNQKFAIFTKDDIKSLKYKPLSFLQGGWGTEIIAAFGCEFNGFYGPWMFVVTRNISVKRTTFDVVGPFYEEFNGWGYEDWEFGYRVHKYGGKILEVPHIPVYHQEHAKSAFNIYKEGYINYLKFYEKHMSFEVGVTSLKYVDYRYGYSLLDFNELVQEFYALQQEYSKESENVRNCYLQLFKTIAVLAAAAQPIIQLVANSGIDNDQLESILAEIQIFRQIGKYGRLMNTLEFLLRK